MSAHKQTPGAEYVSAGMHKKCALCFTKAHVARIRGLLGGLLGL
jgi:hypothetical protein